jgi:hypothetical protein
MSDSEAASVGDAASEKVADFCSSSMETDSTIPQPTISAQNPRTIHHISQPSVVEVEIHIFCYRDLYPSFNSLVPELSSTSPVLIVASGVSSIPVEVLSRHKYIAYGRRKFTPLELLDANHCFPADIDSGRYIFLSLPILLGLDVSLCQILCCDPVLIPLVASLHPRGFAFFPLRSRFARVRSKVPIQFWPAFNFEQYPSFPSSYPDDFSILSKSSKGLGHFPCRDMKDLDPDMVERIREWGECPPCTHCGVVSHRGMSYAFCCKPIVIKSERICHFQWTNTYSIALSISLNQTQLFPDFES